MWVDSLAAIISEEWYGALMAVVVAVCLAALLQLRVFLKWVFPPLRVRCLPEGVSPPEATADLYKKAAAQLAALGFSPPQWVAIAPEKKTPGAFSMVGAVFCHERKNTLAFLQPPLDIKTPNSLTIQFITRLTNGLKLTSQVRGIYSEAVASGKRLGKTIAGDTIAEQWAEHRHWMKNFKSPPIPDFASQKTLPWELQTMRGDNVRLQKEGKLWCDAQGFARPTLGFALRLLWLSWTRPRPKEKKAIVPLARQTMFAVFNERWQEQTLPVRWRLLLLVLSGGLFTALGLVIGNLAFALMLFGMVVLHEGGHYLAGRVFGRCQTQMAALPLFGGISFGIEPRPNAARRAWVAMMGALPGIVLGWGLLWFAADAASVGTLSGTLWWVAVLLLAVNYFNLLPLPPLDGAHIVQAMLPPRWLVARTAFIVVPGIAGIVALINAIPGMTGVVASAYPGVTGISAVLYFGLYVLVGVLALLLIWRVLPLIASDWATRFLAANIPSFVGASLGRRHRMALKALQQSAGETVRVKRCLRRSQAIVEALTHKPMSQIQRLILAVVYIGLLILPLTFVEWGRMTVPTQTTPPGTPGIQSDRPPPIRPETPEFSLLINPELKSAQTFTEQQRQMLQRFFLSFSGLNVSQLLERMPEPPAGNGAGGLSGILARPASFSPPAPADPAKVVEAQHRLGLSFPDDYRDLLLLHDGYPLLQLLPTTQIRNLAETGFFSNEKAQTVLTFYSFAFPPSLFKEADRDKAPGRRYWHGGTLQQCAVIGGQAETPITQNPDGETFSGTPPILLWCPGPEFEQARIVSLAESLWAPDFTTYLRYQVTLRVAARELASGSKIQ